MMPEQNIQERIRSLLTDELQRRVAEASDKLPCNCTHNYRHPLDSRKQVEGEKNEGYNRITRGLHLPVVQTIGLCMLGAESPEDWKGTICDDPADAQRCPVFQAKATEEELKRVFAVQLKDIDWLKVNFPEVHALLWVLGSGKVPDAEPPPPPPSPPDVALVVAFSPNPVYVPPPPPPPIAPWKLFILRLLRILPQDLPALPPKSN